MRTLVAKRLLLVVIVLALCLPLAVRAQDSSEESNPEDQIMETTTAPVDLRAQRKTDFSEARGERIKKNCSALKTRINDLAGRLATFRDGRANFVSGKVARYESMLARLNDHHPDIDTTAFAEDVAKLKTLSDELTALWSTYQTAVEELKNAKCAEDNAVEGFHDALEVTKAAMADVRTKYREIKDFLASDIKPDLQAIRQAIADDAGNNN